MDILIDADVIAHQASTSVTRWIDWGGDHWTNTFDERELLANFGARIQGIQNAIGAEYPGKHHTVLCWSDVKRKTWRHDILPSYKANRSDKPKPAGFPVLRQFSMDSWPHEERENLEADDILGIRGSQPTRSTIIVTIDKDLKQIPTRHYNPVTELFDEVKREDGRRFHMLQTLMGDATDNYKGCPGFGPVSSAKLLDSTPREEWWPAILAAFDKKGLTEEDALVQARVAHILTHKHWDKGTAEPILWVPEDYA